jgi:hypothetical protein
LRNWRYLFRSFLPAENEVPIELDIQRRGGRQKLNRGFEISWVFPVAAVFFASKWVGARMIRGHLTLSPGK